MEKCEQCSKLMSTDGHVRIDPTASEQEINPLLVEKDQLIRELELELAQTKLALVEAECKTQDLTHQLNAAVNEIQASKNTWFQKTLTSIKEATAKKPSDKPELTRKESSWAVTSQTGWCVENGSMGSVVIGMDAEFLCYFVDFLFLSFPKIASHAVVVSMIYVFSCIFWMLSNGVYRLSSLLSKSM